MTIDSNLDTVALDESEHLYGYRGPPIAHMFGFVAPAVNYAYTAMSAICDLASLRRRGVGVGEGGRLASDSAWRPHAAEVQGQVDGIDDSGGRARSPRGGDRGSRESPPFVPARLVAYVVARQRDPSNPRPACR